MWCDQTFSQRNRTTERTVGVEVRGDRGVGGGGTKLEKGWGGGNIGESS